MRKILFFSLALAFVGCTSSENIKVIPSNNWRVADQDDVIDDWARYDSPNKIIDDFNSDGKPDIAQILLKENSKTGYSFVVKMGGKDSRQFVLESNNAIKPQSIAIELLEPSKEVWESACEKGHWDCKSDEVRQFVISKPSIQFCYIESACNVYMWSDRNQNFIKIPISD
ncbi:hypothetical protein [Acinetobacter gerneri]|uniref:hypothetical protein n=1 Tax=Acinetobacter gerneri TaxID=202952 RepID=UPI003A843636